MKYIKSYKNFILEALKDELPGYMLDAVKRNNSFSDDIINMDIPQHNELIPNCKILLNNEDEDISKIFEFAVLDIKDRLYLILTDSHISELLYENMFFNDKFCESLGVDFLNYDAFVLSYGKNFRLVSNNGFSNNKSSLVKFIESFNKHYPDNAVIYQHEKDKKYNGLRDAVLNTVTNKEGNTKLYLYISDKPDDKLRMSISNFYTSCMNLYNGMYNHRLISNVFDPNTKVAYIITDNEFTDNEGNKHPYSPISRCLLRVQDGKVIFDEIYPKSTLFSCMHDIITRYTSIPNSGTEDMYYDYTMVKNIPHPYMDKYVLKAAISTADVKDKIDALSKLIGSDDIVHEDGFYYIANRHDEYAVLSYIELDYEMEGYIKENFTQLFSKETVESLIDLNILPSSLQNTDVNLTDTKILRIINFDKCIKYLGEDNIRKQMFGDIGEESDNYIIFGIE